MCCCTSPFFCSYPRIPVAIFHSFEKSIPTSRCGANRLKAAYMMAHRCIPLKWTGREFAYGVQVVGAEFGSQVAGADRFRIFSEPGQGEVRDRHRARDPECFARPSRHQRTTSSDNLCPPSADRLADTSRDICSRGGYAGPAQLIFLSTALSNHTGTWRALISKVRPSVISANHVRS